jgi:hypothetical protein
MAVKFSRFDIEWWVVQKRYLYIVIALLLMLLMVCGAGLYVYLYGNPLKKYERVADAPAGARFTSLEGAVRVVRAATRETIVANSQTQLYPGDTVQTQEDGRARISLADGSTLLVRPNSTVIVRENTRSQEGQRTNVRVAVDRGQINVRTEQQPEGTRNVVETPQTQNQLASQTGATFNVNPESKIEEIRVSTGQMETSTTSGDKTVVRSNEFVAVNQSGTVARRERLLDVPAPIEPRDLQSISVGASGAASVPLRWQRPAQGAPAHYRVEVATSPFFVAEGKVIERDQLVATEFGASDLRPGAYYWRVRASAASGQASEWSEPQKFVILPKGTNDSVALANISFDYVGGSIYLIRGRAQPGTIVRALGREALVGGNGAFQLQITIPAGTRQVTVQAQDPQGNSNEYSYPIASAQHR